MMKNTSHPLAGVSGAKFLALATLGLVGATTTQAQLISSEPFAGYTTGLALPADTPSPAVAGYTGNWTAADFGSAQPATSSNSLIYSGAGYAAGIGDHAAKGADASGIAAGNSGRALRLLDSSLTVDATTSGTLYLSWLYQNGNENAAPNATTYSTLALYNSDTADANRFFDAGIADGDFGSTNFDFRVENSIVGNLGVALDSNVHLYVARFDLSATAGSDSITVWLDPTLGAGDPVGGITISNLDLLWDRLALSDYASNSMAWDEIRWGSTFNDVTTTVIPEPSAYALVFGAALLALAVVRRRARA